MTTRVASSPPGHGVHLVTDRRIGGVEALIAAVAGALAGGVGTVQLREKDLDGRELAALAARLLPLCHAHGARLLINDRIDVALAVDADGVHLPASSFRVAEARALVGADKIVGVSTHSVAEVAAAASEGADYAIFGPVYATPSKAVFGPARGLEDLRAAVRAAIPVVAIGGITAARVADVRATGAAGVAVISAILTAANARQAAMSLQQ